MTFCLVLPEAQRAGKISLLGWFRVIDRKQNVTYRISDKMFGFVNLFPFFVILLNRTCFLSF